VYTWAPWVSGKGMYTGRAAYHGAGKGQYGPICHPLHLQTVYGTPPTLPGIPPAQTAG